MKYEFIAGHEEEFPVSRMCAVLEVSLGGFYAWRNRPLSRRDQANQALVEEIRRVHEGSRGTYGGPRIHASLQQRGWVCGRHRVAQLMRLKGIAALRPGGRRRITTQRQAGARVAPNLLGQDFSAALPNQKWVADITYIDTAEGWLYLATIRDLCSRMVGGWSMAERMDTSLVENALDMALGRRNLMDCLQHHSDQGSQ